MPALWLGPLRLPGALTAVRLDDAVAALEELVPPAWAEEWDNVGLLVAPPRRVRVRRLLLTIDLTDAVVAEAASAKVDLVIAYHPPIFRPLRRLLATEPATRALLACIAARIAVWSPHTALDAAPGGVNDWLADGLGPGERTPLAEPKQPGAGAAQGRAVTLRRPAALPAVVRRIKQHLGLDRVRVAAAEPHRTGGKVATVALCAGAGASVLAGHPADLWLTGEMRHHDVLAALARGTSVVLCEHSHTERGYLPVLAARLRDRLALDVLVSRADAEPLRPH